MKKQFTGMAVALLALCGWLPAMALEADQVRGEIVEVMPDTDRLTLRVEASGDGRPERTGTEETYEIDSDTQIRRGAGVDVGGAIAPTNLDLRDLLPGDEVVLNFAEIEGRRVARDIEASDREQAADREQADREQAAAGQTQEAARDDEAELAQFETDETGARTRLPATASLLPLLALGGLGFAGAALLVRRRRR
jgi:hypothetical protein